MQLCGSLNILWHCFSLGLEWRLTCGHCWVFQICWYIECSSLIASSFRSWNSSAGIPSPPLALFIVMLPKAHLTSHSSMSGSKWVITPLSLSGSWRSFLYSSSVYSCHLLISSASVRSLLFLSFTVPVFAWNVPLVSPAFLKRSQTFPILAFLCFSALFTYEDLLIFLCYSLELLSFSFSLTCGIQNLQETNKYNKKRIKLTDTEEKISVYQGRGCKIGVGSGRYKLLM